MGDAFVGALVNTVLVRLTSEVIKELSLLWGLNNDILMLKDDYDQIEAVLQDAEEKLNKEKAVESWLKRLKSTSLMVENVLDEISTEALLRRLHKERGIKYRVKAFFSSNHNQLLFRIRIASEVKAIRRKLDSIVSKRLELKLTPSGDVSHLDVGFEGHILHRETTSFIHDSSDILGRKEEMEKVIEKICNKDIGKYDTGEIRVYGIWGMGGLGKTTLAQLVYNHERVNKFFGFKCWVHVSENFQVKEIIKEIIEFIDKCGCTLTGLEALQNSLQSKLRAKKFLIVLDDVWIEDGEKTKWDQLRETLSCGVEGSSVLMTTRSKITCEMMVKVPELQHELGYLSEKDSWLLFKKFAFAEGRERDDISELEPIGKDIVKRCKGLPLAVKTLGSLMWSKSIISDWQRVKHNIIWELKENNVMCALKLSYDNLPPHLKSCFAYCCLFPKGYEMEKDDVIQLWVVNGFIQPKGEIDLYMLGEQFYNSLVWRSFFQVVKEDRFTIHDLMHDLARQMMGDNCLVIEPDKEVTIPHDHEALHLSSTHPGFIFLPHDLKKLTSLRSIFIFGEEHRSCDVSQIFNHVYLRVLYLHGISLQMFPGSICKLKHLKYLNLSKSCITVLPESIMYLQNMQVLVLSSCDSLSELPESICKLKHLKYLNLSKSHIAFLPKSIVHLQNLQVLILSQCCNLYKLPEDLRNMGKLQCLDIYGCKLLLHLPIGIKELTSLRILSRFPLGNKSGAKIGELGDLNLIQGKLDILGLDDVGGLSEAKSANLNSKKELLVLRLIWRFRESKQRMFTYDEGVLEGLEPNHCLKRLKISRYIGKFISPSWMVNLKNLVEIHFSWCENCEHIPTIGRLPSLRVIKMKFMDSLKCFYDNEEITLEETTNRFLCLQELVIDNCRSLVSLPSNLPKLKILKLQSCTALVSLTCNLPELEVLNISLCEGLVSLPDSLPKIKKLHLDRCEVLLSLPKEIQTFKYLNELEILECEHLFKRYEKKEGKDWPKISHIPDIKIRPSVSGWTKFLRVNTRMDATDEEASKEA